MNPRTASLVTAAVVAVMLTASVVPSADASSDGHYSSQLDGNGQALYAYIEELFEAAYEDPNAEIEVSFVLTTPVLFEGPSDTSDLDAYIAAYNEVRDEVEDYAETLVNDVLAALYLTEPYHIWLWDYPVTGVELTSVTMSYFDFGETRYYYAYSVGFTLSVPEEHADSVAETIAAVDEACSTYTGTAQEIVVDINDDLRTITVSDDEDGEVSSIYDALVTGESSSAGIAAAFTHLCNANGVTAVTVRGDMLDGDETRIGYWNAALIDGSWYAVDCTLNSDTSDNCLLAGWSTQVSYGGTLLGFGSTRSADLDMASENSLVEPSIAAVGVDWSEEASFLEAYGQYIVMAVIMLIIAVTLVYAIRKGNI